MQGDEIRALRRLQREQGREKLAARVLPWEPSMLRDEGAPGTPPHLDSGRGSGTWKRAAVRVGPT